ncbi:MAG TPA: hypothetical protein VHZ28_14905 [Terracidiphilus sp.]|nr:hypothetical protein [Terracidiphilus sp.]
MHFDSALNIARRDFLKLASAAGVAGIVPNTFAASAGHVVLLVDPTTFSEPIKRAIDALRKALESKGVSCAVASSVDAAIGGAFCLVVSGAQSALARTFPHGTPLTASESVCLTPGHVGSVPAVLISALDTLGFVYGILELAERVQFGTSPIAALHLDQMIEENPANDVRCVSRYFCSEIEDKSWYHDKAFWSAYLDRLVASRFNRFTFAYGLEYDFPRGVTDDYFHFVYPYLVDVPGYPDVRVMQLAAPDGTRLATPAPLSKAERDQNFEMLRYIAAETGARGLHFQLGIWTHAYQWTDSPKAYHQVEGLTPENHANYCRDALAILLKECPQIQGLTLRVHGESGIPEGSYPFWKTLFEAIPGAGRTIEIDMHAKGVDQTMIDIATATGMPVKLGAKYSAEHQSLGYNQADIRALEIPHGTLNQTESALFRFSSGSRSFTRYGYADFLRHGAPARVLFRLWPGTQRHLLSVDPEMIADCARTASFCGAAGLDLMEPLTFKGREGSGNPGGRCAYVDAALNPTHDWRKYDYYYRVWGRKLYNPDADPEVWRRSLRAEFASATLPIETSLAHASRILPLLTSAHLDSASNHDLWYEMPTSMPIVLGSEPSPYGDTPVPKCFGTVSPLDPQMFSTVVEYAQELLAGQPATRYSPIEVAQWIEDFAAASKKALDEAHHNTRVRTSPAFRRIEEDVLIQIGLGAFFAHKLRSAVLYEIYQQAGYAPAGSLALTQYKEARAAWATMAQRAARVYRADVSYGSIPKRRGHWSDRLSGIDTDLAAMQAKVQAASTSSSPAGRAADAVLIATGRPNRPSVPCTHVPPQSFRPGQPLQLDLSFSQENSAPARGRLFYRHVDQAERWTSVEAKRESGRYTAAIPAEYTQSDFPLQYYFVLEDGKGAAWMHPGFNQTLSNQPYFAIDKREG